MRAMSQVTFFTSWKHAGVLAALVVCAAFAMVSAPAPLQGQCKITPKCDWCSCSPNSSGELVCQCQNCTLGCAQAE
jgi:hypothetical protein